jgi:hypothetical protein
MNMIVHEVAFYYFAILLGSQSMKDLTEPRTDVAVQALLPHLGDENDMIFAVPLAVRQTVVQFWHRLILSFGRGGSAPRAISPEIYYISGLILIRRKGQTLSGHTSRTSGLPLG